MNKKITINDIADIAGVSKTTVSFAFNDPSKISKKMYNRIMEISHKHGYFPNPVARTLNTNRIGTIGLLLPQDIEQAFKNPYYSELLQGLGAVCVKEGFSVTIVAPNKGDLNNSVKKAAVDGYVAVGLEEHMTTFDFLIHRQIPFVCIDVFKNKGIPYIISDDELALAELMKNIVSLGHNKITVLALNPATQFNEKEMTFLNNVRLAGINKIINKQQNHVISLETINCDCSVEDGKKAAKKILNQKQTSTVIICLSDILALGVYQYCHENKIKIPDDISICGFDDIPAAAIVSPGLTTISQQIYQKGQKAGELIFALLNKQKVTFKNSLPAQLVIRGSLGRVKNV